MWPEIVEDYLQDIPRAMRVSTIFEKRNMYHNSTINICHTLKSKMVHEVGQI